MPSAKRKEIKRLNDAQTMPTFLESIRIFNHQFTALEAHQARVNHTFERYFPEYPPLDLSRLTIPQDLGKGLFKCRIVYDTVAQEISFQPYQMANIQCLKLIEAPEIRYDFKFTDRATLQKYYEQREDADDILITQQGFLRDTSYGNIALWNGQQWCTPEVPLLRGTQRERLIKAKVIFPTPIHIKDLGNFTHFKVFNAMRIWEELPTVSCTLSDFKS